MRCKIAQRRYGPLVEPLRVVNSNGDGPRSDEVTDQPFEFRHGVLRPSNAQDIGGELRRIRVQELDNDGRKDVGARTVYPRAEHGAACIGRDLTGCSEKCRLPVAATTLDDDWTYWTAPIVRKHRPQLAEISVAFEQSDSARLALGAFELVCSPAVCSVCIRPG